MKMRNNFIPSENSHFTHLFTTYTGADALIGLGCAQTKCGQAGSGRVWVEPRWFSRTLEYRWRWFPENSKNKVKKEVSYRNECKNTPTQRAFQGPGFFPEFQLSVFLDDTRWTL
jgi:hypothetical protein